MLKKNKNYSSYISSHFQPVFRRNLDVPPYALTCGGLFSGPLSWLRLNPRTFSGALSWPCIRRLFHFLFRFHGIRWSWIGLIEELFLTKMFVAWPHHSPQQLNLILYNVYTTVRVKTYRKFKLNLHSILTGPLLPLYNSSWVIFKTLIHP